MNMMSIAGFSDRCCHKGLLGPKFVGKRSEFYPQAPPWLSRRRLWWGSGPHPALIRHIESGTKEPMGRPSAAECPRPPST